MTLPPKLVTFAHISDTHLHINPEHMNSIVDYPAIQSVRTMIDYINNFGADIDFVLHTGDIMHDPGRAKEYRDIRKILDTFNYPVHYIPGNHDRVEWVQSHFLNRAPEEITPTLDSEFEVNGVQFILLDSHTPPPMGKAEGVISDEQLAWLEKLCKTDDPRPLVVAVHHHTLPLLAPWLDRIGMTNGEDLHNTLLHAKHRLRGVFSGHIHETLITVRDGINYYSTQSGWYQSQTHHAQTEPMRNVLSNPGFNLVTLTEQDTFVRVIRVPDEI